MDFAASLSLPKHLMILTVLFHLFLVNNCDGKKVLVNKDRYETSVNLIKSHLKEVEQTKLSLSRESPLASSLLQLLEANAQGYEAFLLDQSNSTLSKSLIEFDPYGNQTSSERRHGSIHVLYGLGNKSRRVKRGVPGIIGGVIGGGIGGCLGAADLFFLPLVGGLLGGLFGGGAGGGFGGVLELNPFAGPLTSILSGLVAALLAAVGGGLAGLAGPLGGCAGGLAGGAVGGGIGAVLATVLQALLGGPF